MKLCLRRVRVHLDVGCNQIEPENRQILALSISKERNTFVAERFFEGLVKAMVSSQFLRIVVRDTQWLVDS